MTSGRQLLRKRFCLLRQGRDPFLEDTQLRALCQGVGDTLLDHRVPRHGVVQGDDVILDLWLLLVTVAGMVGWGGGGG